jgi:hypothetical protein
MPFNLPVGSIYLAKNSKIALGREGMIETVFFPPLLKGYLIDLCSIGIIVVDNLTKNNLTCGK